jgi:glutathione S-transferase
VGASSSTAARLITIPISHYCEKARWALDRAGVPYREERHVQVVHQIAARRAGGGRTVPVLVTAEGVLAQSAQILAFADRHTRPGARLYPEQPDRRAEVMALERDFDAHLGPQGRRWMYFHILPERDLGRAYNCTGVPAWERRAFPLLLGVMSGYIRHLFAIGPETGAQAGAAVQRTFDAVATRLDDGRRYLCGDAFTAADLAFAALSAPVLVPREYGVALPQPGELPADMAAGVRAFRAHPAGAFACRLFREER